MKKQRRKNRKFATVKPVEQVPAREYIYSFELSRQFPNVRSFIFKKSLSKSMMDTFMELFGTTKKRQGA